MDISSDVLEKALIRLVDAYETDLLRLCYVILSDRHLAQDAVQETFFKAYRSLHRFRGECGEKTWITRIAVNTCRDIRRQRWFHLRRQSTPYEKLHLPDERCKQELTDFFIDLMRLPAAYKEVILLRYYQQLTLEETALALRVSKRTVSNRIKKAKALLRTEL